jgi:hypothetical protein
MEAEVVEDKKMARPCECRHPASLHAADGVGACTAAGCVCHSFAGKADELGDPVVDVP